GLNSLVAIAIGVTAFAPQRWGGWVAIWVAVVLLTTSDVLFEVMTEGFARPRSYPAVPDVLNLVAYVPLSMGLLLLGRPKLPSRDWPLVLDTAAFSLAASLVVWIVLIRPAVTAMHLTGAARLVAIASWVGYIAVLAAAARVLIAWRTNLS